MTGVLVFQTASEYQFYSLIERSFRERHYHNEIHEKAKPIQRKKFDISECEFSDELCKLSTWSDELVTFNAGSRCGVCHDKSHAIALAKHFKLTAEDLK